MEDVDLYYCYFFYNNQIRAKVLESDGTFKKIQFKLKDKQLEKITKLPPVREKNPPQVSKRLISQTNKRLTIQKKNEITIPSFPYEEEVLETGSILPLPSVSSSSPSPTSFIPFSPPSISTSQKRKRMEEERKEKKEKRKKKSAKLSHLFFKTKYHLENLEEDEQVENISMSNSNVIVSHSAMEWDVY